MRNCMPRSKKVSLSRLRSRHAVVLLIGSTLLSASTQAQVLTPEVTFSGARNRNVPITASEAAINITFEAQRSASKVMRITQAYYPKDSLLALDAERARVWVATLPMATIAGMQLDPHGEIASTAKEDALAMRQIAARLSSPSLSVGDRAYTLYMAVRAFATADFPNRLAIAERYATELDALGDEAAIWKYRAREPLIYAYYRLGRSADVARHGARALAVVGDIPYVYRDVFYNPGSTFTYGTTADALSGQLNGRATLRALNERLIQWAIAPQELLAQDSMYIWVAKSWKESMSHLIAMSERIGEAGTPLVANYWVNRGATRDSQSVAVNDGKIRVLEVGSFSCGSCMAAVSGLERLHHRYPGVEFNFMTGTVGSWGNRMIEPRLEAERLAEHFLKEKQITFPIGIALNPRVPTDDDGAELRVTMPTWRRDNYPQISKPTFYILDGTGTIRRVIAGYDRNLEQSIASIIEFLQKEMRPSAGTTAAAQ
jgi:hypothetical protein